jgi:glutamate--cysteine ligase
MSEACLEVPVISNTSELVAHLETGCKPRENWRIGTEHEKFVYCRDTLQPLSYDGPISIQSLLTSVQPHGWDPIMEDGRIIGLKHPDKATITLEPGGQLELSGAPLRSIHETCRETSSHLSLMKSITEPLNVAMLGMGFHPTWARSEVPWMPKGRYAIMGPYMESKGKLGQDMMLRTCTVQVNLDFDTEADMVQKFRIAMALQPFATALFANSPFTEGKPNGFKSYRAHIWTDTDPDRTGLLPFVFEDGMGFERWVDYILDVPMYFVKRDGKYINVAGRSFRDFMNGKLPELPGERPTLDDWDDHMTTAFPEVRLKHYLEMRGADGGRWCHLCALPALWVGLLYDKTAQDAAWDLVKDWTNAERAQLAVTARREGLSGQFRDRSLQDWAKDILAIADHGLKQRNILDKEGRNERRFLDVLHDTVASGKSPADELLDLYHGDWQGSVTPVFDAYAY